MMSLFRVILLGWLLLLQSWAWAEEGASFFLLSDAVYGSNETALVRLEANDVSTVADYGGVDVYVYQVKQPLEFLKSQKNLHRINAQANYHGEGVSNALAQAWDKWWVESRKAWRKVFSDDARQAVTGQAPGTRSHPLQKSPTPQTLSPRYQPMKNHTLVDSFRYPLQIAKPIAPPKDLKLAGSSSEFIEPKIGNVMIPIGQRKPGLYLVEAMLGDFRALTLVFVSDSTAVTKVSSKQMLVWVADRHSSKPVAGAKTVWSDGAGVLATGNTDAKGLSSFEREAPEKTYIYGEDPQGGVYIAENYYYDSEIYNSKIYAVTDRPLYRPGEMVSVKFIGRTFQSSRVSVPLASGELKLEVLDATGFPVANQTLKIQPQTGSDTTFQLPDNAVAGGYELRFSYQGNQYAAAFRVAEYQKPHFEVKVLPDKREFKTKESVTGKLQLFYPDGKPVVNARAELNVRAQRLTMIDGDLAYAGQFPLQLTTTMLTTDAQGVAKFELPAAAEPSRYVLSVLATDGAAYRVRASKELMIERGMNTYLLKAERSFSEPNKPVTFAMSLQGNQTVESTPASWDWVRLENQSTQTGELSDSKQLTLQFAQPGTYTVSVRDAAGNLLGATSHYVSGEGVSAPQGSIEMVFDKPMYRAGETAVALVTFPQKVSQALFTLERDKVEKTSLMADANGWVKAKRISDTQWRVELPVQEDYGPNITFSVVYVSGGEYVFQNLGLRVEQPRIQVAVKADKSVYAPGEKVTLDLTAMIGAKAATGSNLTVSVVDEMVYVLQPEVAPDIFDFFYHPRRNNVRTSASSNFITYDLAKPNTKTVLPKRNQAPQRALKVLERPRREDKDTAMWQPNVQVDANGRATLSFVMPDSLTRWRITVRATNPAGVVGQSTAYVRSDKDFYVKWTSPNWLRNTDQPVASVAVFNQGQQEANATLTALGGEVKQQSNLKLKPGVNFVPVPLNGSVNVLNLGLAVNGKVVDALNVGLRVVSPAWQSPRVTHLPLTGKETPIKLPADASNIRLQMVDGASAQLRRIMDDLIEYPYGCVEQTASRLIPYSIALQSLLPNESQLQARLTQQLHTHRFRLAQMAGPQATFAWWRSPEKDGDAFLTTYAYYADWHASRSLQIKLPDEHFNRLLEVYRTLGVKEGLWERALMLSWMHEIGLPVGSMANALLDELSRRKIDNLKAPSALDSLVFGEGMSSTQQAMAMVLAKHVAQQSQVKLAPESNAIASSMAAKLKTLADAPLVQALLTVTGQPAAMDIPQILDKVRGDAPTIDRALTLLWSQRALNLKNISHGNAPAPQTPWKGLDSNSGHAVYRLLVGAAMPDSIKLADAPAAGLTAVLQYDSSEVEKTQLPVKLERHIYRLVRQPSESKSPSTPATQAQQSEWSDYKLELLAPNASLKTDEVYLDEVKLSLTSGSALRYGIVEVPLPPGTYADRSTWGIQVQYPNQAAAEPLEQARYQQTPRGYSVPVEVLKQPFVARHLIRAGQTGKFTLPPARYYRMYQPEAKAFEVAARGSVEVR